MAAKPIPEGYHTLTPYLVVDDAARAIEFYKEAFGAVERGRMLAPDGRVAHAEVQIGDSVLMLADPSLESGVTAPRELGGRSGALFLYVEDVDAAVHRAAGAGAEVTMPVDDMFWGDRYGKLLDPFGHEWQMATHKEDLTPEETAERAKKAMAEMA